MGSNLREWYWPSAILAYEKMIICSYVATMLSYFVLTTLFILGIAAQVYDDYMMCQHEIRPRTYDE
jgi:hypothetical protein